MSFINGLYKTKSLILPYACWELLAQLTGRQYLRAGTTYIFTESCQMGWNLAGWVLNQQSVPPCPCMCLPNLSYMACQQQMGQAAPQGVFSSPQQGL